MIDKVAVLLGGNSYEREISLESGNAVLSSLLASGINAHGIDPNYVSIINLKKQKFTKVFIALHGQGGEDGSIQGLLEFLKLPYTGSRIMASSLSMDKWRSKMIWKAIGLPVAPCIIINQQKYTQENFITLLKKISFLGFPLIVKPNRQGSSIGISYVNKKNSLKVALNKAFSYDDHVLIEKFLSGQEYTVTILENKIFPSIYIKTTRELYDYPAKYLLKNTQYLCPSLLNKKEENKIKMLALRAYLALDCCGCGRIDFIQNNGNFYLLEANTSPGMTKHSLVPIAANQIGLTFSQLVMKILLLAK
ncbi:D-alanine--D-alanine ligase B [Candidatus Ecksteinia adelgidicola]|nr:D-alanine--D-alanine ligase B [Candidatus Ecksteinia adelgidicola]